MALFFDANQLPAPISEYVAWVDVMGTQASMSQSLKITANFMFKLHIAALQAPRANVRVYPVMDGLYAACANKNDMVDFLRSVFSAVADEFNGTQDNKFRFLIRGGLAYGPSIHGTTIPPAASQVLAGAPMYRDAILLGMPMVQAHISESSAPPFGVYLHESARSFAPANQEPFHHVWWRWENAATQGIWAALRPSLDAYFQWCEQRSQRIGYAEDRIRAHKKMVDQFFA